MDEIGKLERVADKKDRRIVADQVVIAVLGVELDRKSARVAHGVGRTLLASDCRKADESLGSFSDWGKKFGLGPARHIGQHLEISVGARAFGVHYAFGN